MLHERATRELKLLEKVKTGTRNVTVNLCKLPDKTTKMHYTTQHAAVATAAA